MRGGDIAARDGGAMAGDGHQPVNLTAEAANGIELRKVFGSYLVELGQRDERIVVLDNDSDTTTDSVQFRRRFPDRFLEMGIAEKNIFGTAAGLATIGFVPFPTIFATMATRCALDQLSISICYPALNVKIPGHYVGGSKAGASHIPIEDLAVMRALPNMRVADPGDDQELKAVMAAALEVDGPVYFRVSKLAHPSLPLGEPPFTWGKGRLLRDGHDVALFSTGMMTAVALHAADLLAKVHVSALVAHMPSIKPLDVDLAAEVAARTGVGVTLENASVVGGFGSAISEALAEHQPILLERIGMRDEWAHSGSVQQLIAHHGLRASDVVSAALRVLERRSLMRPL